MIERKRRQAAFEEIYRTAYWGENHLSGFGSSVESTERVRLIILKVIREFNISSVVDLACGDMAWMPLVLDELSSTGTRVHYIGCDIVPSLIELHTEKYPDLCFRHLDFISDSIPKAELIICREALQHLPVRDIQLALKKISDSGARYFLGTTHPRRYGIKNHLNIRPGRCRDRNLMLAPFNLPNPLTLWAEGPGHSSKFIGLWALPFEST